MKWQLHQLVKPFNGIILNLHYMAELSAWRAATKVNGYNDWFQKDWNYERRLTLYTEISKAEQLESQALDYFEFGVCGGEN